MNAKDGKGCLAELDEHDKLDPSALSTSQGAFLPGTTRGQCLMLSGQCEAGKALWRKAYTTQYGAQITPTAADTITDNMAGQYCQGGKLSEKDQFATAKTELSQGSSTDPALVKTTAQCQKSLDTYLALYKKTTGCADGDANCRMALMEVSATGPGCFAKAGDCQASYKAFQSINAAKSGPDKAPDSMRRAMFEATIPACKGK